MAKVELLNLFAIMFSAFLSTSSATLVSVRPWHRWLLKYVNIWILMLVWFMVYNSIVVCIMAPHGLLC